MKRNIILTLAVIVIIIFPNIVWAQIITITQIDSARLLAYSQIDCYLSISNEEGEVIGDPDSSGIIIKHETAEGMKQAQILDISRNDSTEGKISFLLVLDNSGSMYEAVGDGSSGNRMDHAVRAVNEFLRRIDNPNVRVGLAVFNTRYILLSKPVKDITIIEEALKSISKPDKENAYTELYYSINMAAMDMSPYRGRKTIVLLSDGEDYPYSVKSGKEHPDFGNRLYRPADALNPLEQEGVTLYGINFSSEKDKALSSISIDSGGKIYDALRDKELADIYNKIKDRIEMEYKVTIKAPVVFLGSPTISTEYKGSSDSLDYNRSSLLGIPAKKNIPLLALIFILSLLIWFVLLKIRFEKPAGAAELSMLPFGNGKPIQRTIALTSPRTVIGGSVQADFTVAGIPEMKESHATIIQDDKSGTYTVVSDEEILVNNQITRKRKLKPGDVINIEGATIVFDAPEQ